MAGRYAILGAGRQGTAAAYALARFFDAERVVLADADREKAVAAADRINALTGRDVASATTVDAAESESLATALRDIDAVISAMPYPLNPGAARAAVAARAHFTDLGGNTDVVRAELALDEQARVAGVTIVPDAGLAPGLSNALAALALHRLPGAREVRMWCGGLPQVPRGLLGYKQVFHIGGLTNEYTGVAELLRGGRRVSVPTFSDVEVVEFPPPVGKAEAFLTSGGTSTCPDTWEGKLDVLEYRTVRYPGHYAAIKPLVDLGFLDLEPVRVGGHDIVPRDLAHVLLAWHMDYPDDPDLVVLRVMAREPSGAYVTFDLLDLEDPATGFTAMERTTAFPAAALAHLQASGGVKPGARRLETAFDPERYFGLVLATGLNVRVSSSPIP